MMAFPLSVANPVATPASPTNERVRELNQLARRYTADLAATVQRNWQPPVGTDASRACFVAVTQIVTGVIADIAIDDQCGYGDAGKESILDALLKSDPLPYSGYESVFTRRLVIGFKSDPATVRVWLNPKGDR